MIKYIVSLNDNKVFENYLKPFLTNREGVVVVDNSQANTMFKKYNIGLDKLQPTDDDIVCFIHEDIKILDSNFENKLEMIFKLKSDVGLVGVYGTTRFEEAGGWWLCDRRKYARGHIMQDRPDVNQPFHMTEGYVGYYDDMVSVDGCFFAMSGKVAKTYRFDETTYNGYHFYDVDASLSILEMGYKVAVADILVEHGSEGPLPQSWHDNRLKFLDKWKTKGIKFPITVESFKRNLDIT